MVDQFPGNEIHESNSKTAPGHFDPKCITLQFGFNNLWVQSLADHLVNYQE